MVVSHHEGVRSQTQVLWESNKCSLTTESLLQPLKALFKKEISWGRGVRMLPYHNVCQKGRSGTTCGVSFLLMRIQGIELR